MMRGMISIGWPTIGETFIGQGTAAWSNPGRVTASDDSRSVCALAAGAISQVLVARAFNFDVAIPADAIIDGWVDEWERGTNNPIAEIIDQLVGFWKLGVLTAANKAAAGNWPNSDTFKAYGGAADIWGETLVVGATMTDATTGGAIVARNVDSIGWSARIDSIRRTVTWHAAPTMAADDRAYLRGLNRGLTRGLAT